MQNWSVSCQGRPPLILTCRLLYCKQKPIADAFWGEGKCTIWPHVLLCLSCPVCGRWYSVNLCLEFDNFNTFSSNAAAGSLRILTLSWEHWAQSRNSTQMGCLWHSIMYNVSGTSVSEPLVLFPEWYILYSFPATSFSIWEAAIWLAVCTSELPLGHLKFFKA